jgi:ubiquitin-activating enzyme E1 C
LQYGIAGVTYRLTQGVVKRIIPNVASTSAVIAAACANEAFKLASRYNQDRALPLVCACSLAGGLLVTCSCCPYLNNYVVFNDTDGVYTYSFEYERKPDCMACSRVPRVIECQAQQTLTMMIDKLMTEYVALSSFQLDSTLSSGYVQRAVPTSGTWANYPTPWQE